MTPEEIVEELIARIAALSLGVIFDDDIAEDADISMGKIAGLIAALALKADIGPDGKVPQHQIPSIALTDYLGEFHSEARMLSDSVGGQRGDWCTRVDLGTDWQLIADDPTKLSSWREFTYPQSPVQSVAGRTGAVTLSKSDVGLGNADNTSDAAKVASGPIKAALDGKASLVSGKVPASQLPDVAPPDGSVTSVKLADNALNRMTLFSDSAQDQHSLRKIMETAALYHNKRVTEGGLTRNELAPSVHSEINSKMVNQGSATGARVLTQAQYDALGSGRDPQVLYFIRG